MKDPISGDPLQVGDQLMVYQKDPVNLGWNFITGIATPTVTISAVPNGTICLGSSVTFTAAITNGGTSQNYNWFVNGVSVQNGSSNTYTSTNITNGATVLCVLTATPAPTTAPPAISACGNKTIKIVQDNLVIEINQDNLTIKIIQC